jgi:hypothetical protein
VRLRRRRQPLEPLDERAAYDRCHGDRGGEILRIETHAPEPPPEPAPKVTGETLRRAFEARLRARSEPPT